MKTVRWLADWLAAGIVWLIAVLCVLYALGCTTSLSM